MDKRHGRRVIRRAAIYLRTTVKGSRRVPKKEAACRAYCEGMGWEVAEGFVVREVASPSTTARAGLQSLLAPQAARCFDVIVVFEFGDLSKNGAQSEQIINTLASRSVSLAIVNELSLEEELKRLERLPDEKKREVKSAITNMILRAGNRQN